MSNNRYATMFRARRGVQGRFAWGREEQERHNAGLKPKRGKTAADRQARKGGLD